MAATVEFHPAILKQYLHDEDDMIVDITKDCLTNFNKYGQIVMRFDDKKRPGKTKKAAKNTAKFSTNWMKSATEFTMTVSTALR